LKTKREPSDIVLSDQTNTKIRRFSHEEEYTGSGISSTSIGVPKERTYGHRNSDTIPSVKEDSTQMEEQMGRNAEEPGRSKPAAEKQSKEADRGRDRAGKAAGEEIQVAGSHSSISGSERTGLHAQLWVLYKNSEKA